MFSQFSTVIRTITKPYRSYWIRCINLLFTIGMSGYATLAQSVIISGRITQAGSEVAVPFASVAVVGTSLGTLADDDGRFQLTLQRAPDSLMITAVGYQTRRLAVDTALAGQPLVITLAPASQTLGEVVVRAGENPAFRILREVAARRDQNDFSRAGAYEYEAYSQLSISVKDMAERFRRRAVVQKLLQPFEQARPGRTADSAFVLPVFLSETVSKLYSRQQPRLTKEHILKTNISSLGLLDDSFVAQFTGAGFNTLNFYQPTVGLFKKEFISPLSKSGRTAYAYFLADTVQINGLTCYGIDFDPKNAQDLLLQGRVWIDTLSYALVQIEGRVGLQANINFVKGIHFEQTYERIDQGGSYWLPERLALTVSVGEVMANTFGAKVEYQTLTRSAVISEAKPVSFFNTPVELADDRSVAPESYWQAQRQATSLTAPAVNTRAMLDTLRNQPIVKRYVRATTFVVNGGYVNVLPGLQVGSLFSAWAYNNVEGHRFRLGLQTSNAFSKRWELSTYAAYGTGDRAWKSGWSVNFIPSRQPLTLLSLQSSYDLDQLGIRPEAGTDNSFFRVVNQFGRLPRAYYKQETSLTLQRDVLRDFTGTVNIRQRTFEPTFPFAFQLPPSDSPAGRPVIGREFTNWELFMEVRYAPGRLPTRKVNASRVRRRAGAASPLVMMRYTRGQYWTPASGGEVSYGKWQAEWQHALRWGLLGRTDYTIQAGYTPATLPFPLLSMHVGNQTPFYNPQAYNLMNYGEFVSDRYVSLALEHRFEGLLSNRLPMIRRWGWRSLLTGRLLWGDLSTANRQVIGETDEKGRPLPPIYSLGRVPYVEVGYGLENIVRLVRIDAIHRLTYRHLPGVTPFTIKASFRLSL